MPLALSVLSLEAQFVLMLKYPLIRYITLLCFICQAFNISAREVISPADSLRARLLKVKGTEHIKTLQALADYYMYSDGRKALSYAKKSFAEAKSYNNPRLQALSLIQEGLAYSNLSSYDTAIQIVRSALKSVNWENNSPDLGRLYTVLGIANEGAGISDSALHYYHEAFKVYSLAKNDQGIVNTYLNLGCFFMRLKKYDEAEINLEKALNESFSRKAGKALGSIYNNLGVVEDVKGKKNESLQYYKKALKYQELVGNANGMANIYHNIGIIHFDLKQYQLALENFNKSINLKTETGNREGIATSLSSMAEVYLAMGKINEAEKFVNQALEIASKGRFLVVETQSHEQLARIYHEQKRFQEASDQWATALDYNDSLYNQSVSRQLSEMQARYELKQKDQENLILKQKQKQQTTNNRFLLFAVIAITIVGVMLFILLRMKVLSMRKSKKLYDLELSSRNTSIQLKNKELTTLSANFISQNEILSQIKKELVTVRKQIGERPADGINDLITMVNSNLDTDLNWKKFKLSFEESNEGFFERLRALVPDLTLNEQKLCAFLFVGLSSNEIALVMNISVSAVNKGRQRIRKRLQIPVNGNISTFLRELK